MHGQQLLERSKIENENVIFIFPPSLSPNSKSPSALLLLSSSTPKLHFLHLAPCHPPSLALSLSSPSVSISSSLSQPFLSLHLSVLLYVSTFLFLHTAPPPFLSYVCFVLDHVYTKSSVVTSRIKGLHIFRSAPHGTSEIVRMYMCISSSLAVLTRAFRVHG